MRLEDEKGGLGGHGALQDQDRPSAALDQGFAGLNSGPMSAALERIAIVGCSGAGKSTFARAIGARLGLPVVHLDRLFWKPGWRESEPAAFRDAVDAVASGERWVTDGNFTSASALRFSRAQAIVWITRPRAVCLWRAVRRSALAFGRTRADLAPGCPERFDLAFYRYIWSWETATRPRLEAAIAEQGGAAHLVRLNSDLATTAFLKTPEKFIHGQATNL